MIQTIEQTREEKIAMYSKLSKKDLIEMLLENQRLVDVLSQRQNTPIIVNPGQVTPYPNSPSFPSPYYLPTIICADGTSDYHTLKFTANT
jgi:hypothetical protein